MNTSSNTPDTFPIDLGAFGVEMLTIAEFEELREGLAALSATGRRRLSRLTEQVDAVLDAEPIAAPRHLQRIRGWWSTGKAGTWGSDYDPNRDWR